MAHGIINAHNAACAHAYGEKTRKRNMAKTASQTAKRETSENMAYRRMKNVWYDKTYDIKNWRKQ